MIRSAARKVMWVGRATVFLVGLAVILALVFGAASMAFAKDGDPWLLGRSNVATAITSLGGQLGVNGPMVRITNNNSGTNDTALDLRVQDGESPMRVNSDRRVTNLNADAVDGKDAPMWAFVNTNGTLQRGYGVTNSVKLTAQPFGQYRVHFIRDTTNCVYQATLDGDYLGEVVAKQSVDFNDGVRVDTFNSAGTLADKEFYLTVFC